MSSPTLQQALLEPFLNTFSSPSCSKGTLWPKMVRTKHMAQNIELERKDEQKPMVGVPSLAFAAHSSTSSPDV